MISANFQGVICASCISPFGGYVSLVIWLTASIALVSPCSVFVRSVVSLISASSLFSGIAFCGIFVSALSCIHPCWYKSFSLLVPKIFHDFGGFCNCVLVFSICGILSFSLSSGVMMYGESYLALIE